MTPAGCRALRERAGLGVRHLRSTVRGRLAEHPGYLPTARSRHREAVVSEATELVIDGFTRSTSTFAVVAFRLAQRRPVRVGHHLHAPGQSSGRRSSACAACAPAHAHLRRRAEALYATLAREAGRARVVDPPS